MEIIQKVDAHIYGILFMLQSPVMTKMMILITNFAHIIILINICLLTLILFKNKMYSKYITLNLIFVFIFNQILKLTFQRERPNVIKLVTETGFSFPSGHSMVSLAFYGFIIYLIYKNIKNRNIKIIISIIISIIILAIGISRVYLGAHYATDVLAGFVFALIYLILFIKIIYKKKIFNFKKQI